MAIEMKFNDFLITQLINITEVKKSPYPDRTINSISIPNRNGEIFQNATFGTRTIEVSYNVIKEYRPTFDGTQVYDSEFNNYIRSLVFYLTTDEPAKLIFSDEPNKFFYAICESIDLDRTMQLGEGTIRFRCSDPFAYALDEKTFEVVDKKAAVMNYGTATSYPIFTTTFTQDATTLTIISNQGIVQIGDSNNAGNQEKANNKDILLDTCDSVTGWVNGSETILAIGGTAGAYHIDNNLGLTTITGNLMLNQAPTVEAVEEGKTIGYTGGFFIKNLPESAKYWKVKEHFNYSFKF